MNISPQAETEQAVIPPLRIETKRRSSDWSQTQVDLLTALWIEGLSASQIAAKIGGITRSAVLGKANRLGLSENHPRSTARPALPRVERLRLHREAHRKWLAKNGGPPPRQKPELLPPEPVTPPEFLAVDLCQLECGQCHFPHGDVPEMKFCGQPISQSRPYCPYHCTIAYGPPKSRRAA